jgi:hypothetical protein
MSLKRTLIGMALSLTTFLPTAALAHEHGGRYPHGASGVPSNPGRYEPRTVSRWVPGGYVSTWVPESCGRGWRHRRPYCAPAHYEQRWMQGHYEQVQTWVWVPAYTPGVSFRLTAGL